MTQPYFEQDGITIYHGDARDVLPLVDADVVITDPPYGVNLGAHKGGKDKRRNRVLVKAGYDSYEDTPENFVAIIAPAIRDALALTERGVVFCAGHMAWHLPAPQVIGGVFLPAGRGRTSWGFTNFAHCLLYGKAPDLHKGAKPTGFRFTGATEDTGHPCPKPLAWMLWAVRLASRVGETILDPFVGSGTTLLAARELGRQAIGIEIEERYCEIAARRLEQTRQQEAA